MDYLVLSPPVCTPSEPAAGAYMLAAALRGHGYDAGLLDLSLEYFYDVFVSLDGTGPSITPAIRYLTQCEGDYDGAKHRGTAGVLHKKLGAFSSRHPGWKLTLMDLSSDLSSEATRLDPMALAKALARNHNPFGSFWSRVLWPIIAERKPRQILISLAYLSQLPATIDLVRFLGGQGMEPWVGGSLPASLNATGHGIDSLRRALPNLVVGNGAELFAKVGDRPMLSRLFPPRLLSPRRYLSSRPVIPLALSSGCYWRRCLFCPDRYQQFESIPIRAIDGFLSELRRSNPNDRPLIHFLDSAVPPRSLREFLPLARQYDVDFYGFARPTRAWTEDGLLQEATRSGLSMLQLGVESGSAKLLRRFDKGVDPEVAESVIQRASDAGIRTYVYLLFGLPGETEADRQSTLALLRRNAGAVDFLNLSVFNLPRFSELTSRAAEMGIEIEDFPRDGAIRLYRPFTCGGISPREAARRFLRDHLNKDPAIRKALLRTPRWFRAAHLALMRRERKLVPGGADKR